MKHLSKENALDLAHYVEKSGVNTNVFTNCAGQILCITKQDIQEWIDIIFEGVENPIIPFVMEKRNKVLESNKKHVDNIHNSNSLVSAVKHINKYKDKFHDMGVLTGHIEAMPDTLPQHLHNESWNKDINEWYTIIKPFLEEKFKK